MRRAERNRWGIVAFIILGGTFSIPVLGGAADSFYPNDSLSAPIFYGGLLIVTVAVFIGVYRATTTRRWWLIPTLCSPGSLVLGFILLANILMLFGSARFGGLVPGVTHFDSYPPGSQPDVAGWTYQTRVGELHQRGKDFYALSKRGAYVEIRDSADNVLLDDVVLLGDGLAGIKSSVTWKSATEMQVELREDSYNARLEEEGGRTLRVLTYRYDPIEKQFKRSE